jgi:hypothetical protein
VTDHRRWLELAAVRPTFATSSAESADLDGHLATCDACAREAAAMRADFALVARLEVLPPSVRLRERVMGAAVAADQSGSARNLATIAAVGLLAAALLGATIGVGAFLGRHDEPLSQVDADYAATIEALKAKRIVWATEVVQLGADRVTIDANGTTFHAETNLLKVGSDPGSLTAWTLEVAWPEAGTEQRLHLYFKADAMSWWVDEVRVYDGLAAKQDWAAFPKGPYFRTLLGGAFKGDIDLAGQGRGGQVRLRIDGAILAVAPRPSFVQPPGGAAPLARDPFELGQPLHCSGILQLSPRDAERVLKASGIRLSWRLETATGPNTGYSDIRLAAPNGAITDTALGSDGELIVFVSDPIKPFGGPPATFPPDCPAPTTG